MRLTFEEELPLWVGCPRNSEEARGGMCHEGRRQPVHHCVITIVIIINSYHHIIITWWNVKKSFTSLGYFFTIITFWRKFVLPSKSKLRHQHRHDECL